MTLYDQFRSSSLDLSVLGLCDGPAVSKTKLTPEHTKVLAWLNGSAVHFCLFPEQGDTVFAVDPNAMPGEQVFPVAEDILTFIGLLICCKDAALIAGAYQWGHFRFMERIASVKTGMKARSVLRALENIYHPPVIQNPGEWMARLRKAYLSTAPVPAHTVGFDIDFSQSCPEAQIGKELVLNRSASNAQGTWQVPSVYLCDEGIVADAFWEVPADKLVDYHNKWGGRDEQTLSLTEKLQRQLEDPLWVPVTGLLAVNDKPIRCKSHFQAIWNPMHENSAYIRHLLYRYRLDPDHGYLFRRYCFLRKGKHPQMRTAQFTLEAAPVMVPGEIFTVHKAGTRFRFTHPGTGLEHSFTALSLSNEALNPNFLTNHPCHYTRLTYGLEPSISPENFRIADADPGDLWEGREDDPAAVIYAGKKPDPGRYALSSLRYDPCDHIRWQMIFRRKIHADTTLKLLP